jgi:hypothetical protein
MAWHLPLTCLALLLSDINADIKRTSPTSQLPCEGAASITCTATGGGMDLETIAQTARGWYDDGLLQQLFKKRIQATPQLPPVIVPRPSILEGLTALFLCRAHFVRWAYQHVQLFKPFRALTFESKLTT